MVRLNVENLEAREVPAANVVASATTPATTASVVVQTAPVVVDFTPPIGSNKGSFAGDGFGTGLIVGGTKS
jgi:hypothetical protein